MGGYNQQRLVARSMIIFPYQGDYDVLITNMAEPSTTRLVKPVNTAHVTKLIEESEKKSSSSGCLGWASIFYCGTP